jgi:hypothetical protein
MRSDAFSVQTSFRFETGTQQPDPSRCKPRFKEKHVILSIGYIQMAHAGAGCRSGMGAALFDALSRISNIGVL